jgi:hypothetical protein
MLIELTGKSKSVRPSQDTVEMSKMIEYEDFSLKIEPKRGDAYPVIVLHSPAGEGRSSFKLPFDPDKIGDILFDLGRTVRGGGQVPLRDVSSAATRTGPQWMGDQLFTALFSGPVRSLLDRSLGMIHGRQRGLRIMLHIDPEDPSLAQLASLPWEFLYHKETREFLNLSRFTPIFRYLDVQRPYIPLSLEPPMRILVVISAPADYVPLDLDRERAQIEASWARQKGVQVEFVEQATILALQDRLVDQPYHVLHYMGHGDFDDRTGQGVLVMEDEDGRGALVNGSTLGVLLHDVPTMRLVFLNACETARVTKEKGLDPFAGVAAAMVMAGIPAVVAMQFPISDSAAITFAQKFYPLLARGDPVDAAVAEGRRSIRLAEAQTMEWGTPVLFMRAPQGVIFRVSEAQREKVPLPQIPEPPLRSLDAQAQADQEDEGGSGALAALTSRLGEFMGSLSRRGQPAESQIVSKPEESQKSSRFIRAALGIGLVLVLIGLAYWFFTKTPTLESQNKALSQQMGDYSARPFRVHLEQCRSPECDIPLTLRAWDATGSLVFENEQTFFGWQVREYRDADFDMNKAGVRFNKGESVEFQLECVDENGTRQRSNRREFDARLDGSYAGWLTCKVGTVEASVGIGVSPVSRSLYTARPFQVMFDSCSQCDRDEVVLYLKAWPQDGAEVVESRETLTFSGSSVLGERQNADFEGRALVIFPADSNANFQLDCEGSDGIRHEGDTKSLPHGNYEEWLSCSTGKVTVSVGIETTQQLEPVEGSTE